MPSALTSELAVSKNTQARVFSSFNSVRIPLFSHVNDSRDIPVLRERRLASASVTGMVVSRQHAEHPVGMHGSCLTISTTKVALHLNLVEDSQSRSRLERQFRRFGAVGKALNGAILTDDELVEIPLDGFPAFVIWNLA